MGAENFDAGSIPASVRICHTVDDAAVNLRPVSSRWMPLHLRPGLSPSPGRVRLIQQADIVDMFPRPVDDEVRHGLEHLRGGAAPLRAGDSAGASLRGELNAIGRGDDLGDELFWVTTGIDLPSDSGVLLTQSSLEALCGPQLMGIADPAGTAR